MREAPSRGFFLASKVPFGPKRIKLNDRMEEILDRSVQGSSLMQLCEVLNDRSPADRGSAGTNVHYTTCSPTKLSNLANLVILW